MADVQLEHGYLRLANRLATAIALAPWDAPAQPCMVMALVRVTYGMNRRESEIGTSTWAALTGMSERNVFRLRKRLQAEGVIELVRDFDARANRAQTWRLRKDFTQWGAFAVSEDVIQRAEAVATRLEHPVSPTTPDDDDDRGTPLTPPGGGQVTQMGGGPLTPVAVGTGSNANDDNDLQRRKTGKTGKTPITKKRATQLPADWSPTDKHRELAKERHVDVELEAEKMRDWAASKGATKVEWDACFRNWLRNATPTPNSNGGTHRQQQRKTPQQFEYTPTESFKGFNP